jgi:hypothetical protein
MDLHYNVYDIVARAEKGGILLRATELKSYNKFVGHMSRKTAVLLLADIQRLLAQSDEEPEPGHESDDQPITKD